VPSPLAPEEIAVVIARRDRAFKKLINEVGPPPPRRSAPIAQRFPTLARAITGQLLATKAAATIHQRIIDLCDGDVTAESIQGAGHANLRKAGLSNAKAAAMLDLAERSLDGRVASGPGPRICTSCTPWPDTTSGPPATSASEMAGRGFTNSMRW
jgi:3-methyladenine DNA glycosylase/8-oxoguanine DNA glycosylase